MSSMFCYQCQETAGGKGCSTVGVCGKKPEVAVAQDFLVWHTKGVSWVTTKLRNIGKEVSKEVNRLVKIGRAHV